MSLPVHTPGPRFRPATSTRRLAGILLTQMALLTGGCAMMPAPGPTSANIDAQAQASDAPFALVDVRPDIVAALSATPAQDLTAFATVPPPALQTVRVGDVLSITLWEYGSGLLAPMPLGGAAPVGLAGAQSATLPNQAVDQSGFVMIPFAGDVRAAGRTTRELQQAIVAALRGKSNDAQALVTIVQTIDNAATVTGDVNHPGRFPLSLAGTRILDAIASAGGSVGKARDTVVKLVRDGRLVQSRLTAVLDDPAQNIFLKPNDVVALDHEPQSIVVLGAINRNAEIPFGKAQVTLAEALGNGGGLTDQQADAGGVYVLRQENPAIARQVLGGAVPANLAAGPSVPMVYHISLKSADGLFLAQSFTLRDRDLVYVSNSPSVQLGKLVRILGSASAIARTNAYTTF